MTPRLSQRGEQAAALALLVFLVALPAILLLQAYRTAYLEREAEIAALQQRLSRYQEAARDQPRFEQDLEQLRSGLRDAGYHLGNSTPALAAAELQQHVQRQIERQGARLVSMQAIEASAASNEVRVRIRLRAGTAALRRLLHELESGRPLVVLDQVYVRAQGGQGDTDQALDAGFDALAYRLETAT